MQTRKNRVGASTGPMAAATGREFWRLDAALDVAARLGRPIEVVVLAEWCPLFPPLTPGGADWRSVVRHTAEEAAGMLGGLTVFSVHASRDVGLLLGHEDTSRRLRGSEEMRAAVRLAESQGADRVVVHAWDTWAEEIDPGELAARLCSTGVRPGTLSLENVPVSDPSRSQAGVLVDIIERLDGLPGITLDLNWASLQETLDELLAVIDLIDNVHVHGFLDRDVIRPVHGTLDFGEAIWRLENLGYSGPYVLELARPSGMDGFFGALEFIDGIVAGRDGGG